MHELALRLTDGGLAFAVPAGVILGAVIALLGVIFTNRANNRRVKTEKLWDHRAAMYPKLTGKIVTYLEGVNELAAEQTAEERNAAIDKFIGAHRWLVANAHKVEMYFSPRVHKRLTKWFKCDAEFRAVFPDGATAKVSSARDNIQIASARLTTALRKDLQS